MTVAIDVLGPLRLRVGDEERTVGGRRERLLLALPPPPPGDTSATTEAPRVTRLREWMARRLKDSHSSSRGVPEPQPWLK